MRIRETIREFIVENMEMFDEEIEFGNDDNIFKMGFIDSMFVLQLVTFIEKEYNFEIAIEELTMNNFDTVNHCVELIQRKLKN